MDKLIPLDVSIRQDQLEHKRKEQQELINQKWNSQQFSSDPQPSDRRSAFQDKYIASAYASVLKKQIHMNHDMIHATTTSPYRKTNKK